MQRGTTIRYVDGRTQGYRLRLRVVDTCDVDPNLFVYEQRADTAEFSNIASPSDIDIIPVDAAATIPGYYRQSTAELVFRTMAQLEASVEDIEEDVQALIMALNQLETTAEQITLTDVGICGEDVSPVGPTTMHWDVGHNWDAGYLWA
jgi:hypothetical protein